MNPFEDLSPADLAYQTTQLTTLPNLPEDDPALEVARQGLNHLHVALAAMNGGSIVAFAILGLDDTEARVFRSKPTEDLGAFLRRLSVEASLVMARSCFWAVWTRVRSDGDFGEGNQLRESDDVTSTWPWGVYWHAETLGHRAVNGTLPITFDETGYPTLGEHRFTRDMTQAPFIHSVLNMTPPPGAPTE